MAECDDPGTPRKNNPRDLLFLDTGVSWYEAVKAFHIIIMIHITIVHYSVCGSV